MAYVLGAVLGGYGNLEVRVYLKEIGHWEHVLARIISLTLYYPCASHDVNCLSCHAFPARVGRPPETVS